MLKEELEVVSAYCVIQNYRYKDKVSVSIEVPDELTTAYVPKNILQPLVENSIYHGIAPMEENGSVEILAEQREDMLDLWVIDTGIGMDEEELKGWNKMEKVTQECILLELKASGNVWNTCIRSITALKFTVKKGRGQRF